MNSRIKFYYHFFVILIAISIGFSCFSCGRKKDAVNVLAAIPLSGDAASYGQVQKQGIEIALSELEGDPVKEKLNVIYADTKLSPKEAVNILQQEMMKHAIAAVMPISTGEVLSLAPVCNKRKVVLLSPLASGDKITSAGAYVYRVSPSDSFQGKELARAVYSGNHISVGVLHVNDAWGKGLSDTFVKSFEDYKGTVVAIETCNPGQTDLRTQLTKLKQSDAEAIVFIVHPGEAIPALKQTRELAIKAKIYGGDTFSHKTIYTEAADVAQGVIFTLPTTPDNEIFEKFSKDYKARFGSDADINAAAARDAIMLIAKAVKAGAKDGITIKKAFDGFNQGMMGATGLIKWDENGDVVSKNYGIFRIEGKSYKSLKD